MCDRETERNTVESWENRERREFRESSLHTLGHANAWNVCVAPLRTCSIASGVDTMPAAQLGCMSEVQRYVCTRAQVPWGCMGVWLHPEDLTTRRCATEGRKRRVEFTRLGKMDVSGSEWANFTLLPCPPLFLYRVSQSSVLPSLRSIHSIKAWMLPK